MSVLCLAACVETPPAQPPAAEAPAATDTPPAPVPPKKPPEHAAGKKKTPVGPGELKGMDEDQVRKHLGEAETVRDDGAAHILTYRSGHCTLDVVLFMDMKAGVQRVLSYQLETGSPRASEARACYARLREGK